MFEVNERYNLQTEVAGGIIKADMCRIEARTALKAAGWRHVGGGSYSSAWLSPDGTRVAKVSKPDRGAEAVCEASCRVPYNKALPSYYARIGLKDRGFAYEVEALEDLDADTFERFDAVKAVVQSVAPDGGCFSSTEPSMCNERHDTDTAARILQEMIEEVGFHRIGWDLHSLNAMMRGDVCVMIDPLFDKETLTESYKGTKGDSTVE